MNSKKETLDKWGNLFKSQEIEKHWGEMDHSSITSGLDDVSASDFGSLIFPVVKRVFASTLAQDLVSVQPLSAPIGFPWMETDMEKLERLFKRLKDAISMHPLSVWTPEISNLRSQVKEALGKAIPGLSQEITEIAVSDPTQMQKLIDIQKLGNDFGI
jgi:hypothetical protein